MSRKHNTRHNRNRSSYGPKARTADQYGQFRMGERQSNDKLRTVIYHDQDEQEEGS